MEIRQLRYFLQLCEDLSFSKASTNLYLTQQALSQSIKNLESDLGVTLFVRKKHGVTMTSTAKFMRSEVEKFLKQYDKMIQNIQDTSKSLKGEIKLAIPPGMLHRIIPIILTSFEKAYPDINVKITELYDLQCEEGVYDERFDVGISVAPIDKDKFDFIPLIKEPCVVMVNRKNPLAAKDTIKFKDLEDQNILLIDKSFKWHSYVLNKCKTAGISPKIGYTSSHPSALTQLVDQNLGITFLIPYEAQKNMKNNIISIPLDESEDFYYVSGFILHKNVENKYIVDKLIDFISANISGNLSLS